MSTVSTSDVFYDSTDFEIMRNPYPTFKRMRDEAPLYYNEERDFYAVSRFDDVASVLVRQQDVHQQVRRHDRPHQVGDRDPAGHRPVRGRACARHPPFAPGACVLHAEERGCARRTDPPVLHRGARPRWSRAASTSPRTSARSCPCASSGCCSASRPSSRTSYARRWSTYIARDDSDPGRLFDTEPPHRLREVASRQPL